MNWKTVLKQDEEFSKESLAQLGKKMSVGAIDIFDIAENFEREGFQVEYIDSNKGESPDGVSVSKDGKLLGSIFYKIFGGELLGNVNPVESVIRKNESVESVAETIGKISYLFTMGSLPNLLKKLNEGLSEDVYYELEERGLNDYIESFLVEMEKAKMSVIKLQNLVKGFEYFGE